MGDGADARRHRRLAAQHRTAGLRPGRGRRPRSMRSSTPARAGSRSTRTTAPTRSSSTTSLRYADAPRRRRRAPHRRPARDAPSSRTRSPPSPGGRSTPTTSKGSGGGHVPDVIGLVREPNIICSSTTPTIPFGRQRGRRAGPDDRPQPRRLVRGRRGCRARPRAGPRGDDGRRGAAPRARRDRDRQLGLAGHGPDDGDGPAHVPARPRHGRLGGHRRAGADPLRRRPSASCATSPR